MNFAADVASNVVAATRLAFARPVNLREFSLYPAQSVFALVALWLCTLLGAKLAVGAAASFWIWGVSAFAARLLAWLAVVAFVLWLMPRREHITAFVTVLIYAAAPITIFCAAVHQLGLAIAVDPDASSSDRALFGTAQTLWYVLSFWRLCALGNSGPRLRIFGLSVLYGILISAIDVTLPHAPMFYRPQAVDPSVDIEAIYYRQDALVQSQLDALVPQRTAAIDVYFLSYGADAGQDVFMREAIATRAIVEERLRLGGRSLSLVNNRQTLAQLPLANLPNLRHALAGIAEQMDRDHDIAFLYLTSHGSDDASLSGEFAEFATNGLHAHDLRRALDDAGILWRVVIVSACYSGSFIHALRSPNTLVITAASKDRTSFGCSHENAWTYFGQAYFTEALMRTRDLVEAFALAKVEIEVREAHEGKLASQPQISLGQQIERHLREWYAQTAVSHSSESTKSE